jgi:hypothetical protein
MGTLHVNTKSVLFASFSSISLCTFSDLLGAPVLTNLGLPGPLSERCCCKTFSSSLRLALLHVLTVLVLFLIPAKRSIGALSER